MITCGRGDHRPKNLSQEFLNDMEMDQAFVASLMGTMSGNVASNEELSKAVSLVDVAMLSERQLRAVYAVIQETQKVGGKLDSLLLERALLDRGELESIGGRAGLVQILEADHAPDLMLEYAERIAARAREQARLEQDANERRRALRLADRIRVEATAEHFSASAIHDWVIQEAQSAHSLKVHRRDVVELVTEEELANLRSPEMLIDDLVVGGGVVVLVGAPRVGKTFLALDWALAIRSGLPWMGHDVQQGSVVYVSSEGSGGLALRLRAWEAYRKIQDETGLFTVTRPVNPAVPGDVDLLVSAIDRMIPDGPRLVVFDTLARCMVGGDENSAADMGRFVGGLDDIKEATGATVLILHHPNAQGGRERGSTALRGAADTMMFLTAQGRRRKLSCQKQKDLLAFKPIEFDLRPFGGSAVIAPTAGVGASTLQVTDGQLQVLRSLQDADLEKGMTSGNWMKATGKPDSTFHNHRKHLRATGLVECDVPGRGAHYRLTERGRKALRENLQQSPNISPIGATTTIPPRGGLSPRGEPALEEWEATA